MNEFYGNEWKYPEDPKDRPPVNVNNLKKDFKTLSGGKDKLKMKPIIQALGITPMDMTIVVLAFKCKCESFV